MSEVFGGETSIAAMLCRHNAWANRKLFEACEGLTDEQLDAGVPGTFGSVRDTLLHIVGAEVSYVARVTGRTPGESPKPDEVLSVERLKQDAHWTGEELLNLALGARPSDIVRQTRMGRNIEYPQAALLAQAIHHGNEHRAQVATMLTQQGIEPPDMSVWLYIEEMGLISDMDKQSASV
jgi:uncharacterized damage-inducible protein DinB